MKALQSGTEVKKYVRIQVVGRDRVGKTSLVHRLLGYGKYDGKPTYGIDINRKCQIRTSDGQWIVNKDEIERKERIRRIQQAAKHSKSNGKPSFLSKHHELNTHKKQMKTEKAIEPDKVPKKDTTEIHKSSVVTKTNSKHIVELNKESVEYTYNPEQMHDSSILSPENQGFVNLGNADQITDALRAKMEDIVVEAAYEKGKSDDLIQCGIWDFAGQKDYYATHQTFFTPYAIYLLVADINDEIKATIEDGNINFDTMGGNIFRNNTDTFSESNVFTKKCQSFKVIVLKTSTGIQISLSLKTLRKLHYKYTKITENDADHSIF
ncbi:Hypothetical predicted protein [Mytilus galloprovincialis]|uniref:Uncharacterized protein n=1 Tax=Mytilus galloprovincialis TaxID=29158 RepID=A0A8B6FXR6_MYTGA|nr:Hypothetical predicted protein [Mytilus galloprovincialis]